MRPSTIRRLTRCPWLLRESGETAGEWGQWRTSRQPRWMGERGCLKRLYALYALFTVVRARRVEEDGSERRGPVVRLVSDTARQTAARSSPTPRASSPVGLSRPSRVPAICLRLPLTSYCTSVYYLSLGLSHNLVKPSACFTRIQIPRALFMVSALSPTRSESRKPDVK